jgi:hypothetical protein
MLHAVKSRSLTNTKRNTLRAFGRKVLWRELEPVTDGESWRIRCDRELRRLYDCNEDSAVEVGRTGSRMSGSVMPKCRRKMNTRKAQSKTD